MNVFYWSVEEYRCLPNDPIAGSLAAFDVCAFDRHKQICQKARVIGAFADCQTSFFLFIFFNLRIICNRKCPKIILCSWWKGFALIQCFFSVQGQKFTASCRYLNDIRRVYKVLPSVLNRVIYLQWKITVYFGTLAGLYKVV